MTERLVLLVASSLLLVASIGFVRWVESERWRRELVAYELHFPREVDPKAVLTFVTGLSGLLRPRWRRLFNPSAVMFETTATARGIRHHLLVPGGATSYVLGQLGASLPQVAAVAVPDRSMARPDLAAEVGLSSQRRPLSVDHPEAVSLALLASHQPLGAEEASTVQWIVAPHPPAARVRPSSIRRRGSGVRLAEDLSVQLRDSESLRAARAKQAFPLFLTAGRVGVSSPSAPRRRALLRRLLGVLHVTNAPGVHFRRRSLPSNVVGLRIMRRSLPLVEFPAVLNAAEVTAVIGWPLGSPEVAGLATSRHRLFAPAASIPSTGRVIGQATFPGRERPLALSTSDSLHHLWVCGPTGTGKSTLLASLISQDLAAGSGAVLVDPKGDLANDVLDRIPAGREGDVILLDPADDRRPVGLNPLAGADRNPELVADQILGIFHRLYKAYWGPRTQDILHAGLLTLAQEPGSTLVELPLLLSNPAYRRRLVGRLDDPIGLEPFWAAYEAMSQEARAQSIGPVMNKLRQFLLRPRLRAVIGQAEPTFTLEQVLNEGKVLVVSLPAGLLGDEAAALVGSLVVARLWQAIQGRAALAPEQRRPVFVYLDEFQTFVHLPTDVASVLAQSRGLGVGFTLAHQHLGQLPTELRAAVSANARSKVVFQTSAGDAAAVARELGAAVEAGDLIDLPAHEVVMSLSADARVSPPASGRTIALGPPTGRGEAARAASRLRYGRDRAEVDAAIRARHEGPLPSGPTLRRKRGDA